MLTVATPSTFLHILGHSAAVLLDKPDDATAKAGLACAIEVLRHWLSEQPDPGELPADTVQVLPSCMSRAARLCRLCLCRAARTLPWSMHNT